MKVMPYTEVESTYFDNDKMKGVRARVVIGKDDGAKNFCMRVFEIAPGGYTPAHSHEWEHEIFVHSGNGEIFINDQWEAIQGGTVIFMPEGEEHQIRNSGKDLLVFVCLIPSGVPEL